MKKYFVALGSLAMLLQGCASVNHHFDSSPRQPVRTLAQMPSCCENLSELGFKKLPINFRARLFLNQDDPVINLDTGKSYVEALALPDSDNPILLQVESLVQFRGAEIKPEIFFPAVTLLDADYNPIAALHDLPFSFVRPAFRPNRIRIVATLDGKLMAAKYVLIHTTDQRLTEGMSSKSPHQIVKLKRFDTMLYNNPVTPKSQIQFSSKGKINVLAYSS